ncbi:MAG: serine/threonine protein kinase, partial [Planctomycetales bacterium]
THGPLPVGQAVDYTHQAAEGLAHAHDMNVMHRDVKPVNLVVDDQDVVKIIDFGLVRYLEREYNVHEVLTVQLDAPMGTPYYMSPEQATSVDVDHRSDVYSLGCTLYYLLTAHRPYVGATQQEIQAAHAEAPIPSPREHREEIPECLAVVFRKMVAKRPDDRYQSMQDAAQALRECESAIPIGESESSWPRAPARHSSSDRRRFRDFDASELDDFEATEDSQNSPRRD